MNIQDIHYNKYIKYKTKYLELKEQNAGVLGFDKGKKYYGNQYNIIKDKIKLFETNLKKSDIVLTQIIKQQNIKKRIININLEIVDVTKQIKDVIEDINETDKNLFTKIEKVKDVEITVNFLNKKKKNDEALKKNLEKRITNLSKENTDLQNKIIESPLIDDNIVLYQSQIIENILSIEEYLLNILLPELYKNEKNIFDDNKIYFSKIFMLICLIIINYREYFYLKKYFKHEDTLSFYLTNNINLFGDIFDYLNLFEISKFKKIKKILDIYFRNVKDSMIILDSFTYTHIKNEYINKNFITLNNTDILSDLKKSNDEYLYSSPTFPLTNIFHIKNKTRILYLLKQNFNLKVLYTFKNNNFDNNIDYIMMLINCYIININMFIINQSGEKINFANSVNPNSYFRTTFDDIIDTYFKNLMITTRYNYTCNPVEMCGPPGESEKAWQGATDKKIEEAIKKAKEAIKKAKEAKVIMRYECPNNECKQHILDIFIIFLHIFNRYNDKFFLYKLYDYDLQNKDHNNILNNKLKEEIEKYFPNNDILIELMYYFNNGVYNYPQAQAQAQYYQQPQAPAAAQRDPRAPTQQDPRVQAQAQYYQQDPRAQQQQQQQAQYYQQQALHQQRQQAQRDPLASAHPYPNNQPNPYPNNPRTS